MDRNKALTVLRITAALAAWFAVFKLYAAFIDPLLEGVLPDMVRMILSSMAVPYTLGLGAFMLIAGGMKTSRPAASLEVRPAGLMKLFVIQTGLSFPCLVAVNIIYKVLGLEMGGISSDELLGNLVFYIVLLLIFNPVFEELLFRKMVLERLGCLGGKGAVICSAVLFALPHVISQGPAQMLYTFALGLVWGYVTLKSGKLWPAIILHSLSNVYGAFIPMIAGEIMPLLSVLFVAFTMSVMLPLAIIFLTVKPRKRAK